VKPFSHAKNSVNTHGGVVEDYMRIHDFIDSSKAVVPDMRHRAMLHSAWGIYIVEQIFGTWITNSDGKKVQVRDIAEEHVLDDLGFIPTMQDYLECMELKPWMGGAKRKTRFIPID